MADRGIQNPALHCYGSRRNGIAGRLGLRSKLRKMADGTVRGGNIMSRGQLHHVLTNPIYAGRIRHKGQVFDGQHPPIIAPERWDRLQVQLSDKARVAGASKHHRDPSPLAGDQDPPWQHFYRHAQAMVRSWTQARFDVGLPEGFETFIEIGAQHSLWDGFLSPALGDLRQHFPDLVIRAWMNNSESLTQAIVGGEIDIAVMYRPEARPGLLMRRLFEDEFVLVTSDRDPQGNPFGTGYTFVDWGPDFRADHAREFPVMDIPPLQVDIGTLGLQHLCAHPASGYFPWRILDPLDTTLRIVPDMPRFSYSAYAVYWEDSDDETVDKVARKLVESASKLDVSVGAERPTYEVPLVS